VLITGDTARHGQRPVRSAEYSLEGDEKDMHNSSVVTAAGAMLFLVVSGCGQPAQDAATAWQTVAEAKLTAAQTAQREKAMAARDAMLTSLKGRLLEVVGSEGPAAAITVCSQEAPQIAKRISQEHGLTIRRTSFRLRNSGNSPPTWAEQFVAERVAEPTYLTRDGRLAVLLPIRLQAQCLICHGPAEMIPDPVKAALAKHYPRDQATGFQDGDLRGWFCVEVPAAPGS
jgi:hypothetical protein